MRFGLKTPLGLAAAVVVGMALATAPMAGSGAFEERTVYVNVMGDNGPVLQGLSDANFRVLEDNVAMEVTGLAPATGVPVSAMLLVDNSGLLTNNSRAASATVQEMRKAVVNFAGQVLGSNPENQVGIMLFGGQARIMQALTSNVADINQIATRLVANTDGGSVLNEALVEASGILAETESPRKIIVIVNHEPADEFSQVQFVEVARAVQASGAQVHGVSIVRENERDAGREQLLNALTANSGGLYFGIGTPANLEGIFGSLGYLATVQYAVTYQRPDGAPMPKDMQVQVNVAGLKVYNVRWAGP
jgi:hypothetical protein